MYKNNHTITEPAWDKKPVLPTDQLTSSQSKKTERVRLEIDTTKLIELLSAGVLYATDFRCLDCESRQCVWRSCLVSCLKTNKRAT